MLHDEYTHGLMTVFHTVHDLYHFFLLFFFSSCSYNITSSYLILSYLILSHLISSYLILSHLVLVLSLPFFYYICIISTLKLNSIGIDFCRRKCRIKTCGMLVWVWIQLNTHHFGLIRNPWLICHLSYFDSLFIFWPLLTIEFGLPFVFFKFRYTFIWSYFDLKTLN